MRATNADRDRVAALVDASVTDGALTPEEGETRVAAVRAAVHRDEFDALLADLPIAAPSPTAVTASSATPTGVRGFAIRHRAWSIVIACLVVLVVVGGVAAAGFSAFDGGRGDHRTSEMHRDGGQRR